MSAGPRPPRPNPDMALPWPPGLPHEAVSVRLLRVLPGAHARDCDCAEFREPIRQVFIVFYRFEH